MATSKEVAKRLMETRVISMLAQEKGLSEKEAMRLLYSSVTYKWFSDDTTGVAREGADAILYRVLNELDGDLTT